ncbi:MAG: hypothetical protein DSZ31_00665 [Gammaproteobacteria bacterium]|nr:MAG: hypothetical protein DSZ31_00665 [Gammaproteobacteria bacterium]
MVIDTNNLLICTDGFGAYITDLKTIKPLPKSEFLSVQDAKIYNDKLVLATNKGVWQYKKDPSNMYAIQRIFTRKDGLSSNLINSIALKDSTLFVGSDTGINTLNLHTKRLNSLLALYIAGVNFQNKTIQNNSTTYYKKNNSLQVQVASIDYSDTNDLVYVHEYGAGSNELKEFSNVDLSANTWYHIYITRNTATKFWSNSR